MTNRYDFDKCPRCNKYKLLGIRLFKTFRNVSCTGCGHKVGKRPIPMHRRGYVPL